MSINENIWGDPESWINVLHSKAKTAAASNWGLVIGDKIPLNETVDNSPCFCGAAGNFYICQPIVFFTEQVTKNLYDSSSIYNWFFVHYKQESGNTDTHKGRFTDNPPNNRFSEWTVPELADYLSDYRVKTVFNLQLNKMLFIPYVFCQEDNSIGSTVHKYSLGEYINTHHTTYPYITGVSMIAAYNSSSTETPTWSLAIDNIDYSLYAVNNAKFSDEFSATSSGVFTSTYSLWSNEITVMGLVDGSAMNIENSFYFRSFPVGADPDKTHYTYNAEFTQVKYIRRYTPELLDEIYEQLSFFGVFFIGDGNYDPIGSHVQLNDNDVFLGTITDGLTYGKYTRGEDNEDQPQFSWDDSSESEYDPSDPPKVDPNPYDGEFHTGVLSSFSTPTDVYVISLHNFTNLISKLWDAMALVPAGDPLNDYVLDTFLTTDPIDSILSVKFFPLSADVGGSATTVKLGKYDTQIACKELLLNQKRVDCGSVEIFPTFGNTGPNWIDRLCTITLYLPFCGSLQLDPDIYMGRSVNVEYAIDLLTGNCSAYVSFISDNGRKVITDIASGNCAIDIPITGIQHMTLDSQLYNATEQIKAMKVNNTIAGIKSIGAVGMSVASRDPAGAAASSLSLVGTMYNGLHNEAVAEYNLDHMQLPIKMIGTTGACTGAMCELTPQIIFERPKLPDPRKFNENAYAHTVGYACCISSTVSQFHGYTEFASADLSGFSATAAEKNAILTALQAGVILP